MKQILIALLVSAGSASSLSFAETKTVSFHVFNAVYAQVKDRMPEGCTLEKADPVVDGDSSDRVIYTFTLTKGNRAASVNFEQSENEFVLETDNRTFESISNSNKDFYLSLDGSGNVTLIQLGSIACRR